MIEIIEIKNVKYRTSINPYDFDDYDFIKRQKCYSALEIMHNTLDYIYDLTKPHYPNVFKPEIYLLDSDIFNAFAYYGKGIYVSAGLILEYTKLIENKYSRDILEKYDVFQEVSYERVLSGLRVYFWRYVILHELSHMWNSHNTWKEKYCFNEKGTLIQKDLIINSNLMNEIDECIFEKEQVVVVDNLDNGFKKQFNITQQALELDADSSAICMMINMMMTDMKSRGIIEQDKEKYIKNHVGFIAAALVSAMSMFDRNAGAKFERLSYVEATSHPLASIRMLYAEEILHGMLCYYLGVEGVSKIDREWTKIVCDVEAEVDVRVSYLNVFYFTAYTEKAQRHLCQLKRRLFDMYDTMKPLVLGAFAEKLKESNIEYISEFVAFSDDGRSLRGWN